jgi:hypothetical protein
MRRARQLLRVRAVLMSLSSGKVALLETSAAEASQKT